MSLCTSCGSEEVVNFKYNSVCKACNYVTEIMKKEIKPISEEEYEEIALSKESHYESKLILQTPCYAGIVGFWVKGEMAFPTAKELCEYEGWI